MPSSRAAIGALLVGATWLPQCSGREDRVTDICVVLEQCTDYPASKPGAKARWSRCARDIEDAVQDGRITRAKLTSCAKCLGHHEYEPDRQDSCDQEPCENCESLMRQRDCDDA